MHTRALFLLKRNPLNATGLRRWQPHKASRRLVRLCTQGMSMFGMRVAPFFSMFASAIQSLFPYTSNSWGTCNAGKGNYHGHLWTSVRAPDLGSSRAALRKPNIGGIGSRDSVPGAERAQFSSAHPCRTPQTARSPSRLGIVFFCHATLPGDGAGRSGDTRLH